jgi:hypothetical protein
MGVLTCVPTRVHGRDVGMGRLCSAAACSFIALAAWVRRLPFWLVNSRVLTECLQSGHVNVAKPCVILIV